MKRSTGLALAAAAILGVAVVAVPVIADQRDGWHGRMGMMEDEDGMMGGRMGGHDMMEQMHGMMRGGMMGGGNRYALLQFRCRQGRYAERGGASCWHARRPEDL